MVGLRREIHAESEARLRIRDTVLAVRAQKRHSGEWTPQIQRQLDEKDKHSFKSLIEYDNKQLAEEFIPAYRRMLDLFREKMWLVEIRTKDYHHEFVEFVEVWDRVLKDSMQLEAIQPLEHDEEKLQPFYQNLEDNLNRLRELLREGN